MTIEHTFGTTTIEEQPQDVVTWGFGSTDAALALGVVPVAIPFQSYGGDDEGLLPWIAEELDELGAETPTVLPEGDEVPFEAIAAADPDVILANYSGITQQDHETLSQIVMGHHAVLVGDELIAAVSPPTVLSLTWGLDEYLSALSAAA